MKIGTQYIIPFHGLTVGEHAFSFQLTDEFFTDHQAFNAQGGAIDAEMLLIRRNNLLEFEITYKGHINILCDRCAEYFNYPIDCNSSLLVKFKDQESETEDDIWILNINENEIDLYQHFYDTLGVMLPIKVTHPDLENGEQSCEVNYSYNDSNTDNEDTMDPRWEKLKNFKTDNN